MKTSKSTLTVAGMPLRPAPDSLPDHAKARKTLDHALKHKRFSTLLADAGYESEGFHSLSQNREIRLRIRTHNLAILWRQPRNCPTKCG